GQSLPAPPSAGDHGSQGEPHAAGHVPGERAMMAALAPLAVAVSIAVSTPSDTVVEVGPASRLWIRNLPGQVRVETWDKSAVRVRTQGVPNHVHIARRGPSLTIEAPRAPHVRPTAYTLTVPSWLSVALVSPDASAHVSGLKGDLMVRTVNG